MIIQKLKSEMTKRAFAVEVRNRFQALQDRNEEEENTGNIDRKWKDVEEIFKKSSESCLGQSTTTKKKEWLKEDTLEAMEVRRTAKKKAIDAKSARLRERHEIQRKEAHREVRRLARKDKREYIESLATEAEEAASKGEQGVLYKITKQICGKFQTYGSGPIKNKDGKLLTTEREIEERWTEHFNEILNRPEPQNKATIEPAIIDLEINCNELSKQEIIDAIKTLRNNKAPGGDGLSAELFKADPETAAAILLPLFKQIWREEKIPSDWTKGIIITIPKKGSLNDCNNYRGITLLSVPSKILSKIIMNRISNAVDKTLRQEQAGFRKNRGCIDQIFTIRNIIEQCTEWQRKLYINFIDFQKAFDSIHRESLWHILRYYGIPAKIVQLIKGFYDNFTCTVGNNNLSFQVKTGVRQGCVMSSLLFNLVIDWVMRRTTEGPQRGIRWTPFTYLEDLDFADDLALTSHTHSHIQDKTNRLCEYGGQVGLTVSLKKTETMILNSNDQTPVKAYGTDLPTTEEFTYLGSKVRVDGGAEDDIKNRLNKARNAMRALNNIWKSSQYSTKTKLRIYNSCVLSTLLYGSECWRMTKHDADKLSAFHT